MGVLMAIDRESVNFKLPKSLVESLRAEAKKRNTSATELVVHGLHHILGETEVVENGIEDVLHQIINRLSTLEANQVNNTSSIESSIENRLQRIETVLGQLAQSIEQGIESTSTQQQAQQLNKLEEKLETVAKNLAQLNNALGQLRQQGNTGRRQFSSSSHQFHAKSVEIQSLAGENLARRLGVDELSLSRERENKSPSEFESWSRHRDPGSRGWRFGEDGLYYPVK
ncbi:all8024 (plasmid) [Nostoc sp. PCC 7120 = FACHB-418]|nr:all8024 [Nostoc sp. PCC 7120 = FACHB-418]